MKHFAKVFLIGFVASLMCLLALPASAQTEFISPGQQKRELKKSLREAKKVKSDYQETHLNVEAYNFKRGESGRKRVNAQERDEALMNTDGTPVTKPKVKPKKQKAAKQKKKK
ncbi:hypothetical protein [Rufibacter roseus]|uniref:Uncharacterized protein n=1 Tax=Rufibacter roseus TaxID=1567108 RepID=A0ABW2DHV0_9BACT|nr:hypothetical protein [Rufibacter roseus]